MNNEKMTTAALAALMNHGATRGSVTREAEMDALAEAMRVSDTATLEEAWCESFHKVDPVVLRRVIARAYTGSTPADYRSFSVFVLDAIMSAYEHALETASDRLPSADGLERDRKADEAVDARLYG